MESLLILIAIVVIDAVVKKAAKKRKQQQQLPPTDRPRMDDRGSRTDDDETEDSRQGTAPRGLQDLIRQFEEFQRNASGGTYVPPTPPVEDEELDEDDDEDELPVVRPANPGHFSFNEIAESVIQWEEASVDYLQDAFGFSEATAVNVLEELQKHKIVGRDMGDGYCDVLVHDKVELANLFKREQAEAKKAMQDEFARKKAELQRKWKHKAETPKAPIETDASNAVNGIDAELDRQRRLNELEARAREAREHAGTDLAEAAALANSENGEGAAKRHAPLLSSKSTADIRRGFLWAKVIDEPRFKKRWSARTR